MEKKIEQWLEKKLDNLKENLKEMFLENQWCHTLTPIEIKFYLAWQIEKLFHYDELPLYYYENAKYPILIPQYKIITRNRSYIADFVVVMHNLKNWDAPKTKDNLLIIELDSYLWHGSTPEQFTKEKERERILQKENYKIVRFSGREINRNVEKCVNEVMEICSKY